MSIISNQICINEEILIYIYIYIRGAFNKFPDIYIQTFKIVVDFWKFSMLLLDIIFLFFLLCKSVYKPI